MRARYLVLALSLAACQTREPLLTGTTGGLQSSLERQATVSPGPARSDLAELQVAVPAAFHLASVPSGWDSAQLTLANGSLLTGTLSRTVARQGGSNALAGTTTSFTKLHPGSGYTLTVKLYAGTTLQASATLPGVSLVAGSNSLTVRMDNLWQIDWLAGTPRTAGLATRLPMAARAVTTDATGNLYLADYAGQVAYRVDAASSAAAVVAGQPGRVGPAGNGSAATAAALASPGGIARDAAGNLYLADYAGAMIRRVDASTGVITTIAGTGTAGFSGDGAAATSAKLDRPTDMVFDGAGNLFFCDTGNLRVRRISTTGVITTVAGGGVSSLLGLATPILGSLAQFQPTCLAYDAGFNTLYIGDGSNVGAPLKSPICALDLGTNYLELVLPGVLQTALGTGISPVGLALDPSNHRLYIADQAAGKVWRSDLVLGLSVTILGLSVTVVLQKTPAAFASGLSLTTTTTAGLAYSGGKLDVCEVGNQRVLSLDSSGTPTAIAGLNGYTGDGGTSAGAAFVSPEGLARDASGSLYLADAGAHRVRKLTSAGVPSTVLGTGVAGSGAGQLDTPRDVAVDASGNLFVADTGNHRVVEYASGGVTTTLFGTGSAGSGALQLSGPQGVATDASGRVYIADTENHRVLRVSPADPTHPTVVAGTGSTGFSGDGGPATAARLARPKGLAVDAGGNLYIADADNHRVRLVAAGVITTVAGNGTAAFTGDATPLATGLGCRALALDGLGGLFIADDVGHAVYKLDGNGMLVGAAGTPTTAGYTGNAGSALSATLNAPAGLAFAADGSLTVADSRNGVLRRLH